MRSLLDRLPMSRVDLMAEYIIAYCVIHNICTLKRDELIVITIPSSSHENVTDRNISHEGRQSTGINKRNLIMNTLQC